MTDRERWTVYPLLFLTMGIAIKDKLPGPVRIDDLRSKAIFCQELIVTDPQGGEQVLISSNANGGFVRTVGKRNELRTILGNSDRHAGLMFVDPQGSVHVIPGSLFTLPGARHAAEDEKDATP
jgi:hypothetical protein